MLARYFDPEADKTQERSVVDAEEVALLLSELRATDANSGRGMPALELAGNDDSALMIAPTPHGCVLAWTDALGRWFHSLGDRSRQGTVIFDYFGSYTEVPMDSVVPYEVALRAARAYLTTGSPITGEVLFQPD